MVPPQAQAQGPPLKFFKNYFVTGDYVVRGVSLWRKGGPNGFAVADIPELGTLGGPNAVPPNADILAAFLYVQTAEKATNRGSGIHNAHVGPAPNVPPASFKGNLGPFTKAGSFPGSGTFAKALVDWNNASTPCWGIPAPGRKLMTYRVDVLRFLPLNPVTNKHALNKKLRIVVPDAGLIFGDDDEGKNETGSSNRPRALGASLVVVYRDASKPYSGIVLYDGAHVKRALGPKMDLPMAGFYQASEAGPIARMTHIVGDGGPLRSERVFVGSTAYQQNPFRGTSGPRWDNVTFNDIPSLALEGGKAKVTVERFGLLPDCLSYSAIVINTTVQDADEDGLLDIWESSAVPLEDPNGQELPLLSAMGANPNHKDLFAQIDYMKTYAATSPDGLAGVRYGGVLKPHHDHLPTFDALQLTAQTFANAPVRNPDGTTGINVHFDVGNKYPDPGFPFIIPTALARGGNVWDEMITMCPGPIANPADPRECQFSEHVVGVESSRGYPGTVGWKAGFRFLRDDLRNGPPPSTVNCDAPGNDGPGEPCERQFDAKRKHTFKYVFSAHAVGLPVAPCAAPDGSDPDQLPDGLDMDCALDTLDFHRPKTNSAITDFPGADTLLTLGSFDDAQGRPVGTPEQVTSTITHEWGHNGGLKHGGAADVTVRYPDGTPVTNPDGTIQVIRQIPRQPNGNPNYLSVMNWSFQLSLLSDVDGIGRIDLAQEVIPALSETGLPEGPPLGSSLYRTRYYAPYTDAAKAAGLKAATKHTDGSELIPSDLPMMRVEATSVSGPIDWNADGAISGSAAQDVNFDGIPDQTLKASVSDWANLRLQETAGRRNVGGHYIDPLGRLALGPMSLDVGSSDVGSSDVGSSDVGSSDVGSSDVGSSDVGSSDVGSSDVGSGDMARGFFGGGDTDIGGENESPDDFPRHVADGAEGVTPGGPRIPSPPNGLIVCLTSASETCVTGFEQPPVADASTPVNLVWQLPKLDPALVLYYNVYRFEFVDDFVAPAPANLPTQPIAEGVEVTEYSDDDAPAGTQLAYFVRASFRGDESIDGMEFTAMDCEEQGGRAIFEETLCRFESGISNFDTVTTPEAEPVVLNFEGFGDFTMITNQYASQGVTFTGAVAGNAGGALNEEEFPPNSGIGVVAPFVGELGGVIRATFTSPVRSAGGYVTGTQVITLTCFDSNDNPLGSPSSTPAANTVSAETGVPPNYFLSVSSPGIASCRFNDHFNMFSVDDFTFTP